MAEVKLSANERDVEYIKDALEVYPHWEGERDVVARGLVARRIGNLDALEAEYEAIIADLHVKLAAKDEKIAELKAFNNSCVALLAEIREKTCETIGLKFDEPKKPVKKGE